jgi:hypothetical protein
MSEVIIGNSALPDANVGLMREAGIGWLRHGFPYPFSDRLGGQKGARYLEARAQAEVRAAKGIRLMGVTPDLIVGTNTGGSTRSYYLGGAAGARAHLPDTQMAQRLGPGGSRRPAQARPLHLPGMCAASANGRLSPCVQ